MLIVFGGLPGTGKTTIAQLVARGCGAVYLRIDAIEQALRSTNILAGDVGPAGYVVAYALCEANLKLGQIVVADCVNPLPVTRTAWRTAAAAASALIMELEIICSDTAEHRRRVEGREPDIPGLDPPSWASVMRHDYAPWTEPRLVIDTAVMSAADAASKILARIDNPNAAT
jgi:predicted kinase